VKPAYRGRFAPSPTGPLHAGSLVAALASWLDARAHGGTWIVRMEDVDEPRCSRAHGEEILRQLAVFGLQSDEPVVWQSERTAAYAGALQKLIESGHAYPCACSRAEVAAFYEAQGAPKPRFGEWVYPGTCRQGLQGRTGRSWRFKLGNFGQKQHLAGDPSRFDATYSIVTEATRLHWHDRRMGAQSQNLDAEVGDFVLQRADGYFAYQLAVVVDDAAQSITHVVRGEDLADNTPRQMALQAALGVATPTYLHTPLVHGADGHKLSKQNGAQPVDTADAPASLQSALRALGLAVTDSRLEHMLAEATLRWQAANWQN
jgi:glutamyl-Q tRNA(Asp) synthetase